VSDYKADQIKVLEKANGEVITRVAFDQWAVQLLLGDSLLIVEGKWQFIDVKGHVLDQDVDLEDRSSFLLWRAVGQTVTRISVFESPHSNLEIVLSSGCRLLVYGDDDDYEDWTFSGHGSNIVCMGKFY